MVNPKSIKNKRVSKPQEIESNQGEPQTQEQEAKAEEMQQEPQEQQEEQATQQQEQQETEEENPLLSDDEEQYDLSQFRSVRSTSHTREVTAAGAISIINSKNGKRIVISAEVMENLKNPNMLQVMISDKGIALCEKFSDEEFSFSVKKEAKSSKGILYTGKLVNEITEELQLDFTNKTSITFHQVTYQSNREYTVAVIKIK